MTRRSLKANDLTMKSHENDSVSENTYWKKWKKTERKQTKILVLKRRPTDINDEEDGRTVWKKNLIIEMILVGRD